MPQGRSYNGGKRQPVFILIDAAGLIVLRKLVIGFGSQEFAPVEGESSAELAVNDVSLVLAVMKTAGHQEIGAPADRVRGIKIRPGFKILPWKWLDDLAEKFPGEKGKNDSQYCLDRQTMPPP